jgi:hypothetical protein
MYRVGQQVRFIDNGIGFGTRPYSRKAEVGAVFTITQIQIAEYNEYTFKGIPVPAGTQILLTEEIGWINELRVEPYFPTLQYDPSQQADTEEDI